MELNLVEKGIFLVGTTVLALNVENSIVDIEDHARRSFALKPEEPEIAYNGPDGIIAQMRIGFLVKLDQYGEDKCQIDMTLEGAFQSDGPMDSEEFLDLVRTSGAEVLIGIARGKIESITANIFNNGKIVIPFVNISDYYNSES